MTVTVTNNIDEDIDEDIEVLDGVEMYRISPIDRIDPFLMSVVSSSDLWMFLSSTGGLTAGRVEAQQCVFPVRDRRSPPSPRRTGRTGHRAADRHSGSDDPLGAVHG